MAKKARPAPAVTMTAVDVPAVLAAARASSDAGVALGALVTAWRAVPDPILADAIAQVGVVAERAVQLPIEGTDEERQATWLALAAKDDAAVRGRLLATLTEGKGLLAKRIPALIATPDPRTTDRILPTLMGGRSSVYYARDFKPLFVAISKSIDPRIVEHIPTLLATWQDTLRYWTIEGRAQLAKLRALCDEAIARHPSPHPVLPDDLRELARAIAGAFTTASESRDDPTVEAALRAAVYAAPADDGPRQIYADWLLERGDPRGEFIVLQLVQRGYNARVSELERGRTRDWLDPAIEPWVSPDVGVSYTRGFPSTLGVKVGALPHPAWATVERIHLAIPASDEHPLPVLREAIGIPLAHVTQLAKLATKPPLERLLLVGPSTAAPVAELAALRLPQLRELALPDIAVAPAQAAALCAIGPLAKLVVRGKASDLAAWHDAIAPTPLPELELFNNGDYTRYIWSRDAAGKLSCLASAGRRFSGASQLETLAAQLLALPAGALTRLSVEHNTRAWRIGARRAMRAALEHHPACGSDLRQFLGM